MNQATRFLLPDHLVTRSLDRLAERRRDADWLTRQRLSDTTRIVPIWRSRILMDARRLAPVYLSPGQLDAVAGSWDDAILLGAQHEHVFFTVGLAGEAPPERLASHGCFEDLRRVAAALDEHDSALLAFARAMVHWHRRRRFCGDCGSPTASRDAGFMRVCTRADCGRPHFPRTDPAIIVLVTAGNRCLLGRQPAWPEGLRSTIAGFVEPGETLEGAVEREVLEETGLEVTDIRYWGSQPWPFPTSLMLGFTARALGTDLRIDEEELEDARWFTRDEIRRGILDGSLVLPSSISIARRLITDWFDAGECGPLSETSAIR